jgi:type III secretory pathway lipoprotein EscJ
MKAIVAITFGFMMTLLVGCGKSPVADDLAQREANKIVAVLGEHGIEATTEKGRGSKGRYSVSVSSGDFGSAVALLTKFNLPVDRGASFEDLMAPSGLLPASADVENLRMDRAVAAEVEQLLLGLDGVSAASVVVRSHSVSRGAPPSVSIVAQTEDGALDQGKARELVTRAVPGVKETDISFILSRQPGGACVGQGSGEEPLVPFLKYWRVPVSEYNSLAYLLIVVMSVVAFLTGVGGYIYGQYEAAKVGDSTNSQQGRGAQPRVTTGGVRSRDEEDEK